MERCFLAAVTETDSAAGGDTPLVVVDLSSSSVAVDEDTAAAAAVDAADKASVAAVLWRPGSDAESRARSLVQASNIYNRSHRHRQTDM